MKKRITIITFLFLTLTACATHTLKEARMDYSQKNYDATLAKIQPLAEKGNAKAQYALGYMYYYGQGVPADKTAGFDWIQKAAAQGLPEALKAEQVIKKQSDLNPLKDQN